MRGSTYPNTIKKTLGRIFGSPTEWLSGSLFFLLFASPVVTVGFAWAFLLQLTSSDEKGFKRKGWKLFLPFLRSKKGIQAFWMGIIDLFLLGCLTCTIPSILRKETAELIRLLSCFLLLGDTILLLSALYRYPFLVEDSLTGFGILWTKGILTTIYDLKNSVLISIGGLSLFFVCSMAGVFLFLLFPGALAILVMENFHEKRKQARICLSSTQSFSLPD